MSSGKKILLILALGVVALVALRLVFMVFDILVFWPLANAINLPSLTNVSSFWIALLLLIFAPSRWKSLPFPIKIRGEVDIAASPEQIWQAIGPFPHDPHIGAAIARTTGVAGEPDRLDFHFETRPDETALPVLHAEISNCVEGEYFALTYLNAHDMPLIGQDLVLSEYFLEPIGNGTRVTQIEHLARIRLTTVVMSLFLNASQDALNGLKANIEGTEDTSWLGQAARNLAKEPQAFP